jgi:addiction module RelE/StbE family toxin
VTGRALPALRDLDTIQDYIARESPKTAYRLVDGLIDRTERLLSANPMIGRVGRVLGTRGLEIIGTPYILAYRISKNVEILAVVHAARDYPEEFA